MSLFFKNNSIRVVIGIGIVIIFLQACGSSKPVKPMEKYESSKLEEPISILNIPVKIDIKELERSINQQLEGTIYEDNDINDGDQMMVRAEKHEDISLRVDSQVVKYRVPLKLWIKYDLGISNVEAKGDIALDFKTAFAIREDWTMETITELQDYEWIKSPKVKLAGMSLPVGFIADLVLKNSKQQISKSIDDMVSDNLKLKELIGETWEQMYDAIQISEEYNTWLVVNPESIGMTPLEVDKDTISSTIVVTSKPKVFLGQYPQKSKPVPVPDLQFIGDPKDNFELHLQTEVPYTEAERLAKAEMVGQTFSQGSKSVTVEDIELYGQDDKLVVNTKLSGYYNGDIYLLGKPEYNKKTNKIEVKNLKFTLGTRNFLLKSAAWLLKGTFKRQLQENMDFLLDYNLQEVRNQMQEQLKDYRLTEGVRLNGDLDELNIKNAYLTPDAIRVDVAIRGKIKVAVSGLN